MPAKRYLMNAGRTTKQGQQINVGKDSSEYQATTTTIIMNPDDMKEAGIISGAKVRVRLRQRLKLCFCARTARSPKG